MQLLLLLLGWLALVFSSGFLALEASRADAEQALQRQAQQQSALLTRDLLLLHQYLLELVQQFADTPGERIPSWQAGMVLQRFPALERVALLRDSEDGLLVTQVVPLRLGAGVVPWQDLARQPAVAANLGRLRQGQPQVQMLQGEGEQAQLLSIYPLAASDRRFIALWLRPQRWLPPLAEPDIDRALQLMGDAHPAVAWPAMLQVREVVIVGEQRYWLGLQRPLRASDFRISLWLPLLLVWLLLLGLLLVGAVFRWRLARGLPLADS
ncbi:hypothetical protein PQU96_04405 [Vogesella sp. LYT5W]|uniref:Uncharacterized protein n=1 Tax=Vogesella margarita TaxID=2984199 RepID=A0ABT5ILE3_9NEIS|nr:hypothetical protein [Vogesella margarita]MDC7713385.1 hypothetical protein [Vogesella margarita]